MHSSNPLIDLIHKNDIDFTSKTDDFSLENIDYQDIKENCKLPHEAIRRLYAYLYLLIITFIILLPLSVFVIVRSSGKIAGGVWVPIFTLILLYILYIYPGLTSHNFSSHHTESFEDPIYEKNNSVRHDYLKYIFISNIILMILSISAIISEGIQLNILKSIEACSFFGSEGESCGNFGLNCYGKKDYYNSAINCYISDYSIDNENNDGYENCSCYGEFNGNNCYSYTDAFSCKDFLTVLPSAEVIIVTLNTITFLYSIYYSYVLYKCLYYPAYYIQ